MWIAETTWTGPFHAPFNAALLETVSRAFPRRTLVFASERTHRRHVEVQLPADVRRRVRFLPFDSGPLESAWALFRERVSAESHPVKTTWAAHRLLTSLLLQSPGPKDLVLTSVTAPILFGALGLELGPHNPRRVEAVIHGNLSDFFGWRSKRPLWRALDMTSALRAWLRRGHAITVLEPHIADALRARDRSFARPGAVRVIPHPIPPGPLPPASPGLRADGPVHIGFLGAGTSAKGLDLYLEAASRLSARDDIAFRICGFLADGMADVDQTPLRDRVTTDPQPLDAYRSTLAEVDYVCLPLRGDYYRLAASGTLLDAVQHLKPVVTMACPATERLFAEAGDIGHLCKDEDHLHESLLDLAERREPARYAEQIERLRRLREARSPHGLAELLRSRWLGAAATG